MARLGFKPMNNQFKAIGHFQKVIILTNNRFMNRVNDHDLQFFKTNPKSQNHSPHLIHEENGGDIEHAGANVRLRIIAFAGFQIVRFVPGRHTKRHT